MLTFSIKTGSLDMNINVKLTAKANLQFTYAAKKWLIVTIENAEETSLNL